MTIPPYARLAARLLKRETEPDVSASDEAQRAAAVAAIERALNQRARQRRWQRAAIATSLVAAASIVLVFALRGTDAPSGLAQASASARGGAPRVVAKPAPSVASATEIVVHLVGGAHVTGQTADGVLREPGGRVQVQPDGQALLAFATGTKIALEGGADLTLIRNDDAQVLSLGRGALRADVAKLAPGRRFLVHTPDAEVEVHGTSFRVLADDGMRCDGAPPGSAGAATHTRVEVFEGVVTVRHAGIEHRIEKGGRWPEACEPVASPAAVSEVKRPAPALPALRAANEHDATTAVPAAPASAASSLIEQNDAFAAAMAARHAGDLERAARGFERVIARYPDGPLAESAAAQQLKVAAELDRARAAQLARDYLARYPGGFARELAAELAAESP